MTKVVTPLKQNNGVVILPKSTRIKVILKNNSLLLFLVPAFIFFSTFVIYPFAMSINISFTDWNGIDPNYSYVGFKNFASLFSTDIVKESIMNTIWFCIGNVFGAVVLGLLLALVFDRKSFFLNITKSVFFIPAVISPFIIGIIWTYMYQFNGGALNNLFSLFNLPSLAWLSNSKYAMFLVILTQWWAWTGYSAIIFLANLQVIPQELYESADIDGASSFQKFREITLPLLIPSLKINLLLSVTGGLRVFDIIYSLTRGGPGYSTSTIGYAIYELGFQSGQIGVGSALSIFVLLLSIFCVFLILRALSKREVEF
jgi:raffinose/stachyose/melibiose transport system permease protein